MTVNQMTILHVDMDAFYASVEQREHPELRGRPVVVGSPPDQRGVVATASYEARAYGIHSAMPSRTAFQRCPHAVFLPVNGELYSRVSDEVMAVFLDVSPIVEQVSIDEAFIDVSSVLGRWGEAVQAARHIKKRLQEQVRLTASVGVAVNKFLAKLASDLQKPDGLTVVPEYPQEIIEFLRPLPVGRIWGVGPKTADRLQARGIRTIGQIQDRSEAEIIRFFGDNLGSHIWRLAHGQDERSVDPGPREEKSISHEETFPEDVRDRELPRRTLIELVERVGRRLRRNGRFAGTVTLKLRFADFRTITRQKSRRQPTNSDREMIRDALQLFAAVRESDPIRLIGFGVSHFFSEAEIPEVRQPDLFPDNRSRQREQEEALDRVVDQLRDTYGHGIFRRGI